MDKGMFEFFKFALQGAITDSPLCADYKNEWRGCGDDKEKLVKLALRQQSLPFFLTYCHQGKGLSKEYILQNFGDYINGNHTIMDADLVDGYTYSLYVDSNGILKPDTDVMAFMWCGCPQVDINAAKCPVLYIGCDSEIHLTCYGYNSLRIYLFDNSKLVIDDADDTCSFVIYKYSKNASIEIGKWCTTSSIHAFEKELRL